MRALLSEIIGRHQVLWAADGLYRMAWYSWPQMAALLLAALVFVSPSGEPKSAPWTKPIAPQGGGATPTGGQGQQPGSGSATSSSSPGQGSTAAPSGSAPAQTAATATDQAACKGSDVQVALATCTRVITTLPKGDPWLAEAYYQRGYKQSTLGKNAEALSDLDQAIASSSSVAGALNLKGVILIGQNKLDEADAALNLARKQNPTWALPIANAADVQRLRNQLDPALATVNEAIKLDSKLPYAYLVRSRIHLAAKRWNDVVSDASNAIGLMPTLGEAYALRGDATLRLGQFETALSSLDEAIRRDHKTATVYMHKGYCHEQLGKLDDAVSDYANAILADPKAPYPRIHRAQINFNRKLYGDTVVDMTAVLKAEPGNVEALILRSRAYIEQKNYNNAIVDLLAAKEKAPKNALVRFLYGQAYWLDEVTAFERCKVQPKSDNNSMFTGIGGNMRVCTMGPDADEVIKELTEAVQLNPNLAAAYEVRGFAHWHKKAKAEATADWRRSLELQPNNPNLRNFLQRAKVRL